jgi:hypothetical protein
MAVMLTNFATVSTVTAQEGENIITNGDFASGDLTGWTTFVADWEGTGAAFGVTDGVAGITSIVNATGMVWHVQMNQIFTADQIAALEVGSTYLISFRARAGADGRPLRVFFGQEGGDFAQLKAAEFTLTDEFETYETTATVTTTFAAMKLGFEAGLSNVDLFIDDISMTETEVMAGGLNLPVDFEDATLDYQLADFGGNASEIVADPTDGTNNVVRSIKTGAAELWAGTTVGEPDGFSTAIPFSAGNTTMSVRVWSPVADIPVRLKVEDKADPTRSVETEATVTTAGVWETLVFDFSSQAAGTAAINFDYDYNKASLFFNFGTTGAQAGELTFFWDDMTFGGESSDTPPPTPVGFVAFNTIGETPVGSGEIFLAAGPNNVEDANVVYRLFYSLTNEAPEDPKTAAEYLFGSTAGDGNGDAAFGFVIAGLEAGTSYTFYLYQYNTVSELYSETPGVATAVSGGTSTSIEDDFSGAPTEIRLSQNYPNPFNPTTQIRYAMPEAGFVTLQVYNLMGQRVATLVNETVSAGNYTVNFDATGLASGMYVYRLQTANAVLTQQMMLVK